MAYDPVNRVWAILYCTLQTEREYASLHTMPQMTVLLLIFPLAIFCIAFKNVMPCYVMRLAFTHAVASGRWCYCLPGLSDEISCTVFDK